MGSVRIDRTAWCERRAGEDCVVVSFVLVFEAEPATPMVYGEWWVLYWPTLAPEWVGN